MLDAIFQITGISLDLYHIDDNVLFLATFIILLFCIGYVFNFFQTLMERLTAKKGR